jgi:hypothetical protein
MWSGLTSAVHRKHGNAAAIKTKELYERQEIRSTKEFQFRKIGKKGGGIIGMKGVEPWRCGFF